MAWSNRKWKAPKPIDFGGNLEAMGKELAQYFRDDSLRDDKDAEYLSLKALGGEIHREFVHRD